MQFCRNFWCMAGNLNSHSRSRKLEGPFAREGNYGHGPVDLPCSSSQRRGLKLHAGIWLGGRDGRMVFLKRTHHPSIPPDGWCEDGRFGWWLNPRPGHELPIRMVRMDGGDARPQTGRMVRDGKATIPPSEGRGSTAGHPLPPDLWSLAFLLRFTDRQPPAVNLVELRATSGLPIKPEPAGFLSRDDLALENSEGYERAAVCCCDLHLCSSGLRN